MARERSALARVEEARFRLKDAEQRLEETLIVSFNALQAVNGRFHGGSCRVRRESQEWRCLPRRSKPQAAALDLLDAEERLYASKVEMLRLIVLKATLELQIHRLIGDATLGAVVPSAMVN
ncbi:MAG: hypothetical protein R3E87_13405 [Burkholderiaceae bacterium]